MAYMVSGGEVDAVLAPFPNNQELRIEYDGCQLIPIPGLVVSLHGSRHFGVSRNELGKKIADTVFPTLTQLVETGAVTVAMRECGFINDAVKDWTVLHQDEIISPPLH